MENVKRYWKYALAILVALLLSAGGGYFAGRHSLPSEVTQTTVQVTDKSKDVKKTDKTVTDSTQQQDKKVVTDVTKKKVTVTKKDGTTVTIETEHQHTGTESETKQKTEKKKDTTTQVHEVDHIVTKTETKIEYYHPKWNIAGLILADPIHAITDPAHIFDNLKYGAAVQYNVIGPLNAGALVLINPADLIHPQVGVSFGFSF